MSRDSSHVRSEALPEGVVVKPRRFEFDDLESLPQRVVRAFTATAEHLMFASGEAA